MQYPIDDEALDAMNETHDRFTQLRDLQLRLTNMSKDEFIQAFNEATGQEHFPVYIDPRFQQFLENPVLFITTRLDSVTGAKFLELCMNS